MDDALLRARAVLASARRVVAFSGAGVSAESGIPTYRGDADSLWSAGNFERFANPRGYRRHLPESYRWYRERAIAVARAQPNPAHHSLAQLEARVPDFTLVTQNVDSLHLRAGSKNVIEIHGHLRDARCDDCGRRIPWAQAPDHHDCVCGGMLRPDVVMFEEMLDERALARAQDAARRAEVLLSIGTSAQVWPAAELPLIAQESGAQVVIVNPDLAGQPAGPSVIGLEGRAGEVLPRLL